MLDSETKRRLDSLRDILVGKLPDPKSQVEQITFGLMYKFMYDMDTESIESGGKPTFFTGEHKKYSWAKLFDSRRGGVDRVRLYSEAIEAMCTNESAPPLFREIFKNSFLPFKDASTLNMFLKAINEFHYSHSEKLGDAYEYLLSFMGSQGDAGQFRTPRHIIDFIVEIIDPKKNERILDPACGTAGFLISSYKHIMNQSESQPQRKKLTAVERKELINNLVGYDISPDMTRISLVNMYLHNFPDPKIWEYDTLSSEDRWNERYHVILANPPFFSPKGGIQPHSRFGVDSKRAEVLFVDYIIQHLLADGRAGIIVPEGIIFQTGRAYKTLRKKLVEDYLVGVISLPAGVFQPYSGVKTSILILDKEISSSTDKMFFATIESDGFDLGAQRNRLDENDLPKVLKQITLFKAGKESGLFTLRKDEIDSLDFNLSRSRYSSKLDVNSSYDIVLLKDYVTFRKGTPITKKKAVAGDFPVIAGGKKPAYYHNVQNRNGNCITVASSGTAGYVAFHEKPIFASDCFTIDSSSDDLSQKFLFYVLRSKQEYIYTFKVGGVQPHVYEKSFYTFQIPLPPIEVQHEIVHELDGYQKIIDGARQVVENYRPYIEIDPAWEMLELGQLAEFKRGPFGGSLKKEVFVDKGYCVYEQYHAINDDYSKNRYFITEDKYNEMKAFAVSAGDLIISCSGTMGKVSIIPDQFQHGIINQALLKLTVNNQTSNVFLKYYLESPSVQRRYFVDQNGAAIQNVGSVKFLKTIPFPDISLEQQEQIAKTVTDHNNLINGNKQIIEIYTKRIQDRIAMVWGE